MTNPAQQIQTLTLKADTALTSILWGFDPFVRRLDDQLTPMAATIERSMAVRAKHGMRQMFVVVAL